MYLVVCLISSSSTCNTGHNGIYNILILFIIIPQDNELSYDFHVYYLIVIFLIIWAFLKIKWETGKYKLNFTKFKELNQIVQAKFSIEFLFHPST